MLGGSVREETDRLLLVYARGAMVLSYVFMDQLEINIEETIVFPDYFKCSNYLGSGLLGDLLQIECPNAEGVPQTLVLLKDHLLNQFVAINPVASGSET